MGRLGAMDLRPVGGSRRRCRQKAEKDESAAHDAPLACRSAAMLCLPWREVKHPPYAVASAPALTRLVILAFCLDPATERPVL